MGNTNPHAAAFDAIELTDDAIALTALLPELDDEQMLSFARQLYYNACVKSLDVLEHSHDHCEPAVTRKWLRTYHAYMSGYLPKRVTPELLEVIHRNANYFEKAKRDIRKKPETKLGLAIYHDDPDRVQDLLRRYPKMFDLDRIMVVARNPNHAGVITAPKVAARFPQYMGPTPTETLDAIAAAGIEAKGASAGKGGLTLALGTKQIDTFYIII